ncbi:stage II sporulation protein P [Dendrosporobacter quercicolus]|uniref:Stage II sporulation protein P n=2 Tax=Dendrosporobacter quercicolus TaxID=146817 RepID=A0A1G9L468_9FIRM|nr:stage II sporulation protein P [Dendrosporobacter quercicolus]
MNKMILILAVVLFSLSLASSGYTHQSDHYFNIVDEAGNIVYITAWEMQVGDECLTADNKRYQVTGISGNTAQAKFVGEINLSQYLDENQKSSFWWAALTPSVAEAQSSGKVAVYHTHSDESYVPTEGEESIFGNGGIYKVGDAFSKALRAKGLKTVHSTAKHDPHDSMAYERSRRTALNLIKKEQPEAIFDVHRDAVPPEVYKGAVSGQEVSKVQLVVGKYGPTGKQIEDYALQIKAASDKQHPGLVKGIFFAKGGDYNQDLHPRSMLIEAGSHTNSRQSAEKGVTLFADVIPAVLGKTGANPANQAGAAGIGTAAAGASGATKSIGWIIGLLIVGGAAFLLISTGSIKEAKAKLKQFATTEFTNFFAPRQSRRKKSGDDREDKK